MNLNTIGDIHEGWRNGKPGLADITIANPVTSIPYDMRCTTCAHVSRTANGNALQVLINGIPVAGVCAHGEDATLRGYPRGEQHSIKIFPTSTDDRFPPFSCPLIEAKIRKGYGDALKGFGGCPVD